MVSFPASVAGVSSCLSSEKRPPKYPKRNNSRPRSRPKHGSSVVPRHRAPDSESSSPQLKNERLYWVSRSLFILSSGSLASFPHGLPRRQQSPVLVSFEVSTGHTRHQLRFRGSTRRGGCRSHSNGNVATSRAGKARVPERLRLQCRMEQKVLRDQARDLMLALFPDQQRERAAWGRARGYPHFS